MEKVIDMEKIYLSLKFNLLKKSYFILAVSIFVSFVSLLTILAVIVLETGELSEQVNDIEKDLDRMIEKLDRSN